MESSIFIKGLVKLAGRIVKYLCIYLQSPA